MSRWGYGMKRCPNCYTTNPAMFPKVITWALFNTEENITKLKLYETL